MVGKLSPEWQSFAAPERSICATQSARTPTGMPMPSGLRSRPPRVEVGGEVFLDIAEAAAGRGGVLDGPRAGGEGEARVPQLLLASPRSHPGHAEIP